MIAVSVTAEECPASVTGQEPFSADQIFILMSAPDDKTTTPDGNNFTE